jgi:hypothetical protein
MIDFTISGQLFRERPREKSIVLGYKNKLEKLFLLQIIKDTSKDSADEESRRLDKYHNFEFTLTSVLISVGISLLPILLLNFNYQTVVVVLITIAVLEFIVILWSDYSIRKIDFGHPLWFYGTSLIKDLFLKINEKWYVYIFTPEFSSTQFSIHIDTESERKLYKKALRKEAIFIKRQVKYIENKPSIEEIAQNKNNLVGSSFKLKGFLEWKHGSVLPNSKGCYIEYILHDKTGALSFVKFYFKRHFWQKTPQLENTKLLKKGKYEVSGIFVKQNNLYYFIMTSAKSLD